MLEIRFHGRGGQGAITASTLLSQAYLVEDSTVYVQSFPEIGPERRGAPVRAFLRINDRRRNKIETPDHVIILDSALVQTNNATSGLKKNGWIILNTGYSEVLAELKDYNCALINAAQIAQKYGIGQKTQPVVNTIILGSFVKASAFFPREYCLHIESLEKAILDSKDIPNQEKNRLACVEAFYETEIRIIQKGR